MESNIIEIAIFSIAVTVIQWISRGTLREALVELATFYRHKDKDEKSILYSVLALTNKSEYHGEAPPQEEVVPKAVEEEEVDEDVVIEKDDALDSQIGILFQDVADLKTYLEDFTSQLDDLKGGFVSKSEFDEFESGVKQYNAILRNDIDDSFKELKKILTFEKTPIVKEEKIIEEIVEETVEEIVKDLEEIDAQVNIPVEEEVEEVEQEVEETLIEDVVEEVIEETTEEIEEVIEDVAEAQDVESVGEDSLELESSVDDDTVEEERKEELEDDEILDLLASLEVTEELKEEVVEDVVEEVVEEQSNPIEVVAEKIAGVIDKAVSTVTEVIEHNFREGQEAVEEEEEAKEEEEVIEDQEVEKEDNDTN
jgi:hypothetical protein